MAPRHEAALNPGSALRLAELQNMALPAIVDIQRRRHDGCSHQVEEGGKEKKKGRCRGRGRDDVSRALGIAPVPQPPRLAVGFDVYFIEYHPLHEDLLNFEVLTE